MNTRGVVKKTRECVKKLKEDQVLRGGSSKDSSDILLTPTLPRGDVMNTRGVVKKTREGVKKLTFCQPPPPPCPGVTS